MAKPKLQIMVGIIVATGVTVTIIAVSLILTHRATISPSNTTTTTSFGSPMTTTKLTDTTTTVITGMETSTMAPATTTTRAMSLTTTRTTTTALTNIVTTTTILTDTTMTELTDTTTAITTSQCVFASQIISSVAYNSQPSAVVSADVNGDQKPDIIVGNNGADDVIIFLNVGNGMFQFQGSYSTGFGSAPLSVASADINGDSTFDIIVANYGTCNVGVLLNEGNRTFATVTIYTTGFGSSPYSVVIADVNGDTKLDIIVANIGTNNVGIFLNMGTGTFTSQTTYSTGSYSQPTSVATADVNGDNRFDIIVANSDTNNVMVLLNLGDGTFMSQATYSTGSSSSPQSVTAGDVNGDGKPDIIIANVNTGNVGILFNRGDGTFNSQITYSGGDDSPISVVTADVNGDKKLDIIVANWNANNIGVFLNTYNGTFPNETTYSTGYGSGPRCVITVDVNGDNQLDIIVSNLLANNVTVFLNTGNGIFQFQESYSTDFASLPYSVATGDVNGDNEPNIIVANSGTNSVGIVLNTGKDIFSSEISYWTGFGSSPYSAVIGDVNGDSYLDIIVANHGTDNIGIFFNMGNGIFSSPTSYSTGFGSGPQSLVVADVNDDNKLDIVIANQGTNNVGVFLNIGNGSFNRLTTYSTAYGSNSYSVSTVDINGDNKLDIIVANYGTNNVGVLLNIGNGTFSRQKTYSTGSNSMPSFVIATDVNSDNKPDIIVANSGADNVGVFLNIGNGTFSSQITYSTGFGSSPRSLATIDMNDDGKLDIVVANSGTNNVTILLNSGDGTLTIEANYSTGSSSSPQSVAVADVDGDNKPDIIVASYGTNSINLLLSKVKSTFSSQTSYSTGTGSYPWSVAAADVNGDNKLDIIVANLRADNIDVLLNSGNGIFNIQRTYSTGAGSTPYVAVTGDINGDNKLDLIVANFGTNNVGVFSNMGDGTFSGQTTYSTGSESGPVFVTTADVNGDEKLDIIVANYNINNICILFNTGNGTFDSQTTYSTGDGYLPYSVAAADVNGDDAVDIIVAYKYANSVGVFFNTGNGTFTSQTTYSTGSEFNPGFATAADVNGDNKLDLLVAMCGVGGVGIFLNTGNDTFGNQALYSAGDNACVSSLVTADVNDDNQLDIIYGNSLFNNVGVFVNIGNGRFSGPTTYSTGFNNYQSGPQSVAMGDVNGDNKLDIIVANPSQNSIGILLSC